MFTNHTVKKTQMLVELSLFTALTLILARFASINLAAVRIGFSFIPIMICGIRHGAIPAACAAGMADFLGAMLFPFGVYHPGITLCAVLTGFLYGLFFSKRITLQRIGGFLCCNTLFVSLGLMSLFLHQLYETPYWTILLQRLPNSLLNAAIAGTLLIVFQKGPLESVFRRPAFNRAV